MGWCRGWCVVWWGMRVYGSIRRRQGGREGGREGGKSVQCMIPFHVYFIDSGYRRAAP